jgi:ATP-dependent Zn protease
MNAKTKTVIFWAIVGLTAALLFTVIRTGPKAGRVTYTQFLRHLQADEIATATIRGGGTGPSPTILVMRSGARLETVLPPDYRDALAAMEAKGVSIDIQASSTLWMNAIPFLILLALWFVMLGRKGGQPQARPT